MFRWLRWQGLVAFIVVVGLLVGGWVLFIDRLTEWAVESGGTAMVGARVELDGADVGLAPLRVELSGLQVTNPGKPMRNAFEAGRIAFDADTWGLLLDRLDIGEMAVEGLRLNTPRESSGAVAATPTRGDGLLKRTARSLEVPALELPGVDEALAAAQLQSPGVIREAREDLQQRREGLDQRLQALPSKETIDGYEQRLDKLREDSDGLGGRLSRARDAKALLAEVRRDLKAVRKARDAARETVRAAEDNAERAREAPEADVRRLYEKYSDPATVAQELARYVLGPRVAGWINSGWYWYNSLSPYLGRLGTDGDDEPPATRVPRSAGRRVLFPEADPRPGTLIRRVSLSGGEGGRLSGEITDIAAPARLWPRPLKFDLGGRGLPGLSSLQAEGALERSGGQPRTRINLVIQGADLGQGQPGGQGVALAGGVADLTVQGDVVGETLALQLRGQFRETAFAVAESAGARAAEIARALEGVDRFDLNARVTGTTSNPELALQSGLADALKGLVGQVAADEAQAFRQGVAERVRARVAEPLSAMAGSLEALRQTNAAIEARGERLEALQERLSGLAG